MGQQGLEWLIIDSPVKFLEVASAPSGTAIQPNIVHVYAKDKAGTSALYLKDDSGSEREIAPPNVVTGTGTANRMTYWVTSSTIGALAALTVTRVPFSDSNGLLTDSAKLVFDSTTAVVTIGGGTSSLSFRGLDLFGTGTEATSSIVRQTANGTGVFPNFQGRHSRGTAGTPTASQADDIVSLISAVPYGATGYAGGRRASIVLRTGENQTDAAQGTYLTFETTPLLSTTIAERFRVGPSGQWGIGGATFGTAGQYFRSGGASAAPTWATISDADLGSIFFLLAGRSGGQVAKGGTAAGDALTLQATSGNGVGSELIKFLIGNNGALEAGRIYQANSQAALNINTTLAIGSPLSLVNISDAVNALVVAGNGANANALFFMATANTSGPTFSLRKTRGTNITSPSQTLSGDLFGTFECQGANAAGGIETGLATFRAVATENITTTGHGSKWDFLTVANGSITQVANVIFPEDGGIAIVDGITAPATLSGYAKIYVDTADGDLKVKFGDGTVKTIVTDT